MIPTAWDADAAALVAAVVTVLREALGDELVSVVVHGSLAMGCYRAPKADVDVLAVCAAPLTPARRRAVTEALLAVHDARRSGAGLEFSLVTAEAAREAAHPMPFEVHAAGDALHVAEMRDGTYDYALERRDPDLAAHVTVTRARGVTVYGRPAGEVFVAMPWRHHLAAVEDDFEWALAPERVAGNTVYFVLNACRVLQIDALGEGTVMSKAEGAAWAIDALPAQYRPLIAAALEHYLSGEPEGTAGLDMAAVGKFVEFVSCRSARAG